MNPVSMNLEDLINKTAVIKTVGNLHRQITDITADSRKVKEGSLFICLCGSRTDGHQFAAKACREGASAVIAEKEVHVPEGKAVIYVRDTRKAMEDITPYFFGYPAQKMRMIAVTGTNGKTTSTHIINHILIHEGYKSGLIGTIHALIGQEEVPTHNTTPDVIDLQKLLYRMQQSGATHVSMEVSSHALALGRVEGCEFDTAGFTNLTEDHLDFHKTMDNYAKAKAILFHKVSSEGQVKKHKTAVINADDPYAHVMTDAVDHKNICGCIMYSIDKPSDLKASNIKFNGKSSDFDVAYKGKTWEVHTHLAGRFNVYNVLTAMGCALAEGIPMDHIIDALSDFHAVPGRFELIDEGQPFTVVVDYAHTPDGLENILKTAKEITRGRIITVFGCGGDRDKMKRPIMGRIAAQNADVVIVTSDNPRTEDPEEIVKEVAAGVKEIASRKPSLSYVIQPDRRTAIQEAVGMARPGDIVLIAGKGHENYQILKTRTIHFDDREEARKALRR